MTNPTSNFGWQMPTSTDLVTDLPADFEVFGQAVDTSLADLKGGTTGQILSKTTGTDMDFTWITNDVGDITEVTAGTGISGGGTSGAVTITNSMATAMTTSGDLIQATGSGTFARLGTGTNGQYLTTNGTTNSWGTISLGSYTTISTASLSGTTLTISSIPGTYKELVLVVEGVTATTNNTLGFRVNGITSATYETGRIRTDSTTVTSETGQTQWNIGATANSSSTSNNFTITFPNYTSTVGRINGIFSGGDTNGGKSGTILQGSNAAITSITLFTVSGGTFNAGTYTLYGVK